MWWRSEWGLGGMEGEKDGGVEEGERVSGDGRSEVESALGTRLSVPGARLSTLGDWHLAPGMWHLFF